MNSAGDCACVQIDFTPLGAYRFFGLPMRELSGRMVGLDDLADREIAELRRKLEDADDWNARLDLAETFVLERLRRGPRAQPAQSSRPIASWPSATAISASTRSRRGSAGAASICRSASRTRSACRRSRSPASSASTGRSTSPTRRSQPDWADLAAECGYADQAHLTREFAEFAGATPGRLLARAA